MTETPIQQLEKVDLLPLRELLMGIAAFRTLQAKVAKLEVEVKAIGTKAALGGECRKKWFTLSEAAKWLRCSQKTIIRWIKDGKLRRNLQHRRVLIPVEDIENFEGRVTLPLRA